MLACMNMKVESGLHVNNSHPPPPLSQALAQVEPLEAVKRYESGLYASNDDCFKAYLQALVHSDRLWQTSMSQLTDMLPGGSRQSISSVGSAPSCEAKGGSAGAPSSLTVPFPSLIHSGLPDCAIEDDRQPSKPGLPVRRHRGSAALCLDGGWFSRDAACCAQTAEQAAPPLLSRVAQEPSAKTQVWRLIRSILLIMLVLSAVNQIMDDKGIGKSSLPGCGIAMCPSFRLC